MNVRVSISPITYGLVAVASICLASPVAAQRAALEDVTVTARKTEESILEVPLSVTAFNEIELERQNIVAMEDLAQWTPALQFQDVNGTFQNPAIRGLAQTDQISPIGNVGVFLDGVPLSNRSGLEFGMLDLARIEVVKGPQSALYGRNSFAGSINYVTKPADLEDLNGRLELTAGTEELLSLQGTVNVPLGKTAALRLFGGVSEFDGTITNVRNNSQLGGWKERDAIGGTLLWQPTDSTSFTLFGMHSRIEMDAPVLNFSAVENTNCGSPTENLGGVPRLTLYCGELDPVREVNRSEGAGGNTGDSTLFYAKLEQQLWGGTVTATVSDFESGYSLSADTATDPNAINIPLFIPGLSQQSLLDSSTPKGDANSFELRFQSNSEKRLRWSIGTFWFNSEDIDTLRISFLPLGEPNGDPVEFFSRDRFVETTEIAIFGTLAYDFTDKFTAALELRYADENLKLVNSDGEELDFENTIPRLVLEYSLTDDWLLFSNLGKGVKAGGFNVNVTPDSPARTFGEESNWSFEVGAKGTLFDDRLTLTGAVWYIDWQDIQVQTAVENSPVSAVQNFGSATSTGVELEGLWVPTDNWSIRASLAVMNPEYDNGFIDGEVLAPCGEFVGTTITEPGCTAAVGGNQISRTSDLQATLQGTYYLPPLIGTLEGYISAGFSHEAAKYSTGLNFNSQGDINLANARIGLVNDRWDISLWVDNLFDEDWNRRITTTPATEEGAPATGVVRYRVYPGELRMVGLDVNVNF